MERRDQPPAWGRHEADPRPPAASLRSTPEAPPGHLRASALSGRERLGELPIVGALWRSDRLDPGGPGARALVAVAVVAVLLVAGWLWLSRPQPQPISMTSPAAAAPRLTTEGAAPSAMSSPTTVVVQVAGKVRHPGVVTLPAGSRVTDAITAAGGLVPGADTGTLNLARRVTDGEQILVAVPGAPAPPAPAAGPAGAAPTPGAPLDLNSATLEQLQELPGLGPVFAQRIIDYRTQHGGFRTVQELRQISGIGTHRFAQLQPLVRV